MNLNCFKEINLFNAGTSFFKQLNIRLNSSSTLSLPLKSILKDKFKSQEIFEKVSETCFLGLVDKSVFDDNLSLFEDKKISYEQAGKKIHAGYEGMMIFAVRIEGIALPTRTQLADLTRAFNRASQSLPVVVLFQYGNLITLATSERITYKQPCREGEKIGKISLLKDIDTLNPHTGHIKILNDLVLKPSVRDFNGLYQQWREVFDVQLLNRNFYKELSIWYFWAVKETTFPSQNDLKEDIRNPINIIRLITRIIFVWFVKEKGLIPDVLFNKEQVSERLNDFASDSSSYYKAILQNLFFATLNTKMEKREFRDARRYQGKNKSYMMHNRYRYKDNLQNPVEFLNILKDIPFLNGGLFECLDRETKPVTRIDGFSEHKDNELNIPNYLFFSNKEQVDLNKDFGTSGKRYKVQGLINLLQSYKFTISENTPIEEEIALDPELLGNVFENLLASYNPETQTTARKQTGSFYTPREIVNYMVDESLIAYLENKLIKFCDGHSKKKKKRINDNLCNLLSYNKKGHAFNDKEARFLINVIDNIKILDPACGSGAFPMGILHRLVFILRKLDPENRQWKTKQIDKANEIEIPAARKAAVDSIEYAFEKNKLDYARKLYLIKNCIFGVDIQSIAVQIAKLRFFISLIVDQNVNNKETNRGIKPLPNLETKIVAANTLVGFKSKDKSPLKAHKVIDLENELKQVRKQYFDAQTREMKKQCEEKDKQLREQIGNLFKKPNFLPEVAINLSEWDPYNQNQSADFFDAEWMFGEKQGFDVVIGNPPYVRQEKIKELKPILKNQYVSYSGVADLYVYFYERGLQLLKTGGILTYISSNKYLRSGYGKKLRKFLGTNALILQLIDFGDAPVFTSIAYPSIIVLKKLMAGFSDGIGRRLNLKNQDEALAEVKVFNWKPGPPINEFSDYFKAHYFKMPQQELTAEGWRLEPPEMLRLLEKIKKAGKPLSEYVEGKFYRGIVTGFNNAFVIDSQIRNRLIDKHPSSSEIIKPLLRGRDVKRWHLNYEDLWLIFTRRGINIDQYPAIHEYLKKYKKRLTPGIQGGRKAGSYKWYEIQDNIAYWQDFEQPKIIYPNICKRNEFAWDESGYYTNQKAFIIPNASKYLLGVLNSNITMWLFNKLLAKLQNGYYEPSAIYIKEFPIPFSNNSDYIESRVNQILYAKNNNTNILTFKTESQIDAHVAHLYNLTEEEYSLILKEINCPDPFRVAALNIYRDIARERVKGNS